MYLKEIKAHGFKSFADKISIELSNNITGIVGPNGSGKSNVVDAVRWALGEPSIKSLRGNDSTDVIFSGSKSRNPLNVSSVTLVFDNSDNYLPLSFNEVSIRRRLYRDGTNEYYLNNEKCRLKDITDILIDTGISKESFNIISQGKIDDILSTKPQERRTIFEEAAGVLKYKKRKEEALRKLDRTHTNMTRVEDIINELEPQVLPLKEQKEIALEYLDVKRDLEDIEIALIVKDITDLTETYKDKKNLVEELNIELLSISTDSNKNEAVITELKSRLADLELEFNKGTKELIDISTKVEQANSRKNMILERKKYEVEDSKLHNTLIENKERISKMESDISKLKVNIDIKKKEINNLTTKKSRQEELVKEKNSSRLTLEQELNNKYRSHSNITNKILSLKDAIENNSAFPTPVKAVLENPKLSGIHNVLGHLLDIDEDYTIAISTSLGYAASNIVVDNERIAKDAIIYLKNNNLGRVTFFPMNIIKPRGIDPETLSIIEKMKSFVSIASDLVRYDKQYHNIVLNQLGNIIVARDIDGANEIAKKIAYKYRIVTLDGQVIHAGGTVTGGSSSQQRNIISMKADLDQLERDVQKLSDEIKTLENNIILFNETITGCNEKLYSIDKEFMLLKEEIDSNENNLNEFENTMKNLLSESTSISNKLSGELSSEEETAIEEYYDLIKIRDEIDSKTNGLSKDKETLRDELDEIEHNLRQENSVYNNKSKELNTLEIEINRTDVKLDTLLNTLSETYNITYEKASLEYTLELDINIARKQVNTLKKRIKEFGMVNLGAIDEYDRVSTRYEFLIKQREDLVGAENTLLEIINEMDSVMKDEFIKTFNIIKKNFTETFKELFNGGNAELYLTDPEDILGTGIEIDASPPGKKLTSITLLSGGEKTLTAIALLFAILKSKFVPFCLLDEIEAALDDVNVVTFGKYLQNLAKKTQFIVITHKKKTMEFVNNLYGITMQESGVSKLVSVKLEDIK